MCTIDNSVSLALKTVFNLASSAAPSTSPCVPKKDWWNTDCATAAAAHRKARRSGPIFYEARHQLRSAVRQAKRDFWRRQVDQIDSLPGAFRIMKWGKSSSAFGPPPIVHDGSTYATPKERADILFRTKLLRSPNSPDLPKDLDEGYLSSIPLPITVTEEDVECCLLETSSTSPGLDFLASTSGALLGKAPNGSSGLSPFSRPACELATTRNLSGTLTSSQYPNLAKTTSLTQRTGDLLPCCRPSAKALNA